MAIKAEDIVKTLVLPFIGIVFGTLIKIILTSNMGTVAVVTYLNSTFIGLGIIIFSLLKFAEISPKGDDNGK